MSDRKKRKKPRMIKDAPPLGRIGEDFATEESKRKELQRWQLAKKVTPCRVCNVAAGKPCVIPGGSAWTQTYDLHMGRWEDYVKLPELQRKMLIATYGDKARLD